MPFITVFTPTYNRERLLPRLFDSLTKQTFTDFEWLIVDDGSTDGTSAMVDRLKAQSTFPVAYCKKANGGKHSAINTGVQIAKGDLFFFADSDDMLPPDSLGTVVKYWNTIKGYDDFAGVCGLDGDLQGRVIGSGLPKAMIDASALEIRNLYHVTGDMKEVFRTSVLREFPFPEIPGERFCPEALIWNRIAQKYKLRYFNKIIYTADYQPSGITSQIARVRMQSPIASMMTYAEMTKYHDVPIRLRVRAAINYWRFRCCVHHSALKGNITKVILPFYLFAPIGLAMHWMDVIKVRRN